MAQTQFMGDSALIYINAQLRHLFSATNYTNSQVRLFFDHTAHFVEDSYWSEYNTADTLDPYLWTTIHEEMFWAQFDTAEYEHISEFYSHVNHSGGDTADVGVIRMAYYKLKDSALYDSTYYFYDTINNHYTDNLNRTSEPYSQHRIFAVSCLSMYLYTGSPVFRFSPDNIITDSITNLNSGTADGKHYSLIVDLRDGSGWQEVETDSVEYLPVEYDSGGVYVGRAAVVNNANGDTIDFSQFNIIVNQGAEDIEVPTIIDTNLDTNIEVGIYSSCDVDGENELGDKYIIYVEGFDFLNQISIQDNYRRLQQSNIAELRNHGYNIVIVNWMRAGDGIATNAMRLVRLIDNLKCELSVGDIDTLHQFVVIGESMGGLVARYALSWMEANNNLLQCRPDLMHNTRLFISYDAPQDGAYVPMAFQELYAHFSAFTFLPWALRQDLRNRWDILRCDAAKEILKLHQITNPYNYFTNPNIHDALYSPTSQRDQMMSDLVSLKPNTGGYPEFCKKMAISNGLLTGEEQLSITGDVATPGLDYLRGEGDLSVRIFGNNYEIQHADLNLSSLDGTINDFFSFQRGMRFWKIVIPTQEIVVGWCPLCMKFRVPWGFPTFQLDYIVNNQHSRYSTTAEPWDVMPGGHYNFAFVQGILPPNGFSEFVIPIEAQQIGPITPPGITITTPQFNINWGLDLDLTMELGRFNFIPIQSALDYQIPGQPAPLAHDIYFEDINTKLSRTPFDVITGEVNGGAGNGLLLYPQNTADFTLPRNDCSNLLQPCEWTFPGMNNDHLNRIRNHRRNDSLINSNTSLYPTPLYAFYLNREIGEEELLLENLNLNRTALFESEYVIFAGSRLNPYYEYPNQNAQEIFAPYDLTRAENTYGYDLNNNAIFSKEETFNVTNGTAVLRTDSLIDVTVNGGMVGPHIEIYQPQWVCVLDFWCFPDTNCTNKWGGKEKSHGEKEDDMDLLSLYPNPVVNDGEFHINTKGVYFDLIHITDLQGRTIMKERFYDAYQVLNFSVAHLNINSGVYVVNLRNGLSGTFESLKLIVQ